jgi:hypothetical protein
LNKSDELLSFRVFFVFFLHHHLTHDDDDDDDDDGGFYHGQAQKMPKTKTGLGRQLQKQLAKPRRIKTNNLAADRELVRALLSNASPLKVRGSRRAGAGVGPLSLFCSFTPTTVPTPLSASPVSPTRATWASFSLSRPWPIGAHRLSSLLASVG